MKHGRARKEDKMAGPVSKVKGKVGGRMLAEFDNLTITASPLRAKREGRNRLWLQIRQNNKPKKWRVSTALIYARSADIQFVEEFEGEDATKLAGEAD
jgi:hypothetical protein